METVIVAFEHDRTAQRVKEILEADGAVACLVCRTADQVRRASHKFLVPVVVIVLIVATIADQYRYNDYRRRYYGVPNPPVTFRPILFWHGPRWGWYRRRWYAPPPPPPRPPRGGPGPGGGNFGGFGGGPGRPGHFGGSRPNRPGGSGRPGGFGGAGGFQRGGGFGGNHGAGRSSGRGGGFGGGRSGGSFGGGRGGGRR